MTPTSHAKELHERGYVVFEDLLEPSEVAWLRGEILGVVERLDPPTLYAERPQEVGENASVTTVGLAIRRLLRERPDLLRWYVRPPVRAFLAEVLGEGLRLEDAGAMVSDSARPFFSWHTHIDGEDEGVRARAERWPQVDSVRRVLTLLYLDDVDREAGPLHVVPRRVGDPTEPPGELDAVDWPGQVELTPRAGSLVAFEQCTWHAALPRRRPGHRVIAGAFFAAPSAPPAPWADPQLAELAI
jgi:ectoine hydroxylase-related dioxygenase (phytanoyl-CoA dioxygenase family)